LSSELTRPEILRRAIGASAELLRLPTGSLKMTRMHARKILQEIVTADDGAPRIDYSIPFQKGAMSTGLRRDAEGEPEPFMRRRLIPGHDRQLNQFFAYKRHACPTSVLHALKNYHGQAGHQASLDVRHFIRRAAIYLARAIRNYYTVDAVIPAPSSTGLARQLAADLAVRLGNVPVLSPPERQRHMAAIGVGQRMRAAKANFKTPDQPWLNGTILIVDDFSTSGSTLVGIAGNLLDIPDVKDVIGAALAIF
jgi:predicted amidophosphoribosyltransferase